LTRFDEIHYTRASGRIPNLSLKDDAMLRTLSLFAVCTLLSLPAAAEEKAKPDAKDAQPRIKVFRLQVADPNDVLQAFNALVGGDRNGRYDPRPTFPRTPAPDPAPAPGLPALPPGGAPSFESSEEPVAYQDVLPPGPPSSTQTLQKTGSSGSNAPEPVVCRAVADVRTRSLIVRGTAKDLQLAADVVAVLDTAEDKPLPGVTSFKPFRLKHADAVDFVGILQALDPNPAYRVVPVGRMKILLATGTDEQMKELAEAVKELDIPAKDK
jgi:hypothetical protein